MSEEPNPYAPPKFEGPALATGDTALEAIRREHINAETSVKTVGFLLYLGAVSSILRGLDELNLDTLLTIGLGCAMGVGGFWLRRMDRRGRMVFTVVTAIGLVRVVLLGLSGPGVLGVVMAMAWPIVLLAFVWEGKASTVMTPHYRDVVIPATPNVKRKTSTLVVVLGLLLLAVLGLALLASFV